MHPLIGKKAPYITLPSATSESYELKPGSTGKPMALFFFPQAGTYGCTKESCEFRDALTTSEVFKRTECEVVGVSSDAQDKQKKFVDENGLPYPVLCDTEQKARKAYSVGRGLMNMTEGRATFVIDGDGTVLDVYESVLRYNAHKKFVEKTLATLSSTGGPSGTAEVAEAATSETTAVARNEEPAAPLA